MPDDEGDGVWDDGTPLPDEDGVAPMRPFEAVSLTEIFEQGVPEPERFCNGMCYPGCVHVISGPPDTGKTTLLWWFALEVMRSRERVLMLDEECGREMAVDKLTSLGATRDDFAYLKYVEFPNRTWGDPDLLALHILLDEFKPKLVGWDSSAAFMGGADLDENDGKDCQKFYKRVLLSTARSLGVAHLVLDHDTKNGAQSRYSRGHGSKLAYVDVQIKVDAVERFNRGRPGMMSVEITKDRPGWITNTTRRVRVPVPISGIHFVPDAEAAKLAIAHSVEALAPADAKVYEALADPKGDVRGRPGATTISRIIERVKATHGNGLRRETVSRSLGILRQSGLVRCVRDGAGPNKPSLWVAVRPDEPQNDESAQGVLDAGDAGEPA